MAANPALKGKNYTQDELDELTDEEREGLLEEDEDDENGEGAAGEGEVEAKPVDEKPAVDKEADDDKDPDDEEADEEAKPADDAAVDAAAVAATAAAAAAAPPPAEARTVANSSSPLPVWKAPADIDTQIGAVKADKAALAEKFDAGELTGKEYNEQLGALDDKLDTLKNTKFKAEMSFDSRRDFFQQVEAPQFLADHPEFTKGIRYKALNDEVLRLQTAEIAAGNDQFRPGLLAEALANVEAELGVVRPPKPTPKPSGKEREIPPTLGSLPAADAEDIGEGNEFGWLDKLKGDAYDEALMKLQSSQPEKYDRYMAQA